MASVPGTPAAVEYPDSDGRPMSDNSVQYRWIVTIKENLELLFQDRADVFVAGNNLIYAVEGLPKRRIGPDVYVAFGRPKGDRGSYKVWAEGGIFPQVVFEVRSPGNRAGEMARKLYFYDRYGAEEYYDYDPDRNRLRGYRRTDDGLEPIAEMDGWVSPRLGVRFEPGEPELVLRGPDGRAFRTVQEIDDERRAAVAQAAAAVALVAAAEGRATVAEGRAAAAQSRAEMLAAKLRALGLDPDAL